MRKWPRRAFAKMKALLWEEKIYLSKINDLITFQ